MVELIGGTGVARTLCLEAVNNGKHLVTANKALLAEYGLEIYQAAAEKHVDLGFEASVCGAIPIIRSVREGLVANHIHIHHGYRQWYHQLHPDQDDRDRGGLRQRSWLRRRRRDTPRQTRPWMSGGSTRPTSCRSWPRWPTAATSDSPTSRRGHPEDRATDIAFARALGYRIKLLAIAKEDQGEWRCGCTRP